MNEAINSKLLQPEEAIGRIRDHSTIACSGFVGAAHPETLTRTLEQRFLETGTPRSLTLVYGAGQGDGKSRGLNVLAHRGLLKRVIGGHWGLAPRLGQLAMENEIEAYNFPQGVICQLFRDIASGRPGCLTHVGLGTFIDPLQEGGRLNQRTTEPLIQRIDLDGRTWLFYPSFPIDVGFLRATAADANGGLLMEDEAIIGEVLQIAQAVRNSGGIVIAQVKRLIDHPVSPKMVSVPGILVDHIVLAREGEHDQTYGVPFDPSLCEAADFRSPELPQRMPMDERRIIASRACDELPQGAVCNLGIGMPEGIALIAAERGWLDRLTLTVESGPIGGRPTGGLNFGASVRPQAIIDQPSQFDFYDGGGLSYAALGAAQIDRKGNVNVSKFGSRFVGVGGFVNIAQNARKLVFCGTMTTNGLKVEVVDEKLKIVSEGRVRKFVENVEQICFSSIREYRRAEVVLYVTERAVFGLNGDEVELLEVAPGIDIESQVVAMMGFRPRIRNVQTMGQHCFRMLEPRSLFRE